ncbi:MAG TPA: DUF952 domain-containing protein [Candidatus Binataceae bacterium]|nr:DUF952 domain-containing protein [Candidatus Binataceae bacterium]
MKQIFHITTRDDWEAAQRGGVYVAPSLDAEGFIHCSTIDQVVDTANSFYRGRRDLVLLCIDESRLKAPLRYESPANPHDSRADQRFPHLYGPLNLDAVTGVVDFPCESDGSFVLPATVAPPE